MSLSVCTDALGTFWDDYSNLVTLTAQWKTMRGEHLTKKGAAINAAELRREASDALRAQPFDNLLFIARRNQGQPDEISNNFSQHLLAEPSSPEYPADPEP